MEQDREKLLDRVRKLYAMSQESESSPHEAEIAARRVESLRVKYGITEAELVQSDYDTGVGSALKKSPPYVDWISLAVGRANDCVVDKWKSGGYTQLRFNGFAQDVALAQLQYDYIITQMNRHWEEYKATLDRSSKAINGAFKRGYASKMSDRLNALADERGLQLKTEAGTALVPMKMAMVAEEFGKQKVSKRKRAYGYTGDGGANAAGKDAARRTGINGELAA